jgi:acyl carrier protein
MDLPAVIRSAIAKIAPDVDASAIPDDVEYREEAELDSMDFLNVLGAVADATGVEVPEADYPKVLTIAAFADYLSVRGA